MSVSRASFQASKLFTVTAEGNTHADVFANLAGLAEVFSVEACGNCNSEDIIPIVRVVGKASHYEIKCRRCNARLTLSKNMEGGTLYPRKRYHEKQSEVVSGKAKAGDWIPNKGWEKYVPEPIDDADEPVKKGR